MLEKIQTHTSYKKANCVKCSSEFEIAITAQAESDTEFEKMMHRLSAEALSNPICDGCLTRQRWDEREAEELKESLAKIPPAIAEIVGAKYRECCFENYAAVSQSQKTALSIAKNFSVNPSGFIYFHGKPGVGKTHLSVSIFRENAKTLLGKNAYSDYGPIRKRLTFRETDFWTVPDMLLHLRSEMSREVSEEAAIEPMLKSKLLILDDLGSEKMSDWVRQAFYVLISHRERHELPTVITSNLSLGEIESRIGDERITSRIGGASKIVKIEGVDNRISKRQGAAL